MKHDTQKVIYHAETSIPRKRGLPSSVANAAYDAAPRFPIRDGDGKLRDVEASVRAKLGELATRFNTTLGDQFALLAACWGGCAVVIAVHVLLFV